MPRSLVQIPVWHLYVFPMHLWAVMGGPGLPNIFSRKAPAPPHHNPEQHQADIGKRYRIVKKQKKQKCTAFKHLTPGKNTYPMFNKAEKLKTHN